VELVRIGRPLRPEFAAWRYGDQFGRRRRRHLAMTGAVVVAGGAIVVAGPMLGLFSFGAVGPFMNLFNVANAAFRSRKIVRVALPGRDPIALSRQQLGKARLVSEDGEWYLSLRVSKTGGEKGPFWRREHGESHLALTGEQAVRAAGAFLPVFNAAGASERGVQAAVQLLEKTPDPEALFAAAATESMQRWKRHTFQVGDAGVFKGIPVAQRLALEMAAHEETERRAMEGELALLEAAWRDAEEIAKIADDLTLPSEIDERLRKLKGDTTGDR